MTENLDMSLDWSGLQIIDTDECFQRLAAEPIGRLAFVDAGEPVILPVNLGVDGRTIVFRSGAGSKLAAAIMEQPVCFEVDGYDESAETGWSVVLKGVAEEIVDDALIARLEGLGVRPWSRPDLRWRWVRIRTAEVSGRRIV